MQPDTYYHIYNRANGSENLFRKPENYRYFLRKWEQYISPVAVSLAYCLMPNHFHFLIRVREEAELAAFFDLSKGFKPLESSNSSSRPLMKSSQPRARYDLLVSRQFSHLFNGYAQAYNRMFNRKGSLFAPNFKKKTIGSDSYLTRVIAYIHLNPVHHGFVHDPGRWPYSSYPVIVEDQASFIDKAFLIDYFDSKEEFISYHHEAKLRLQEIAAQFGQ